MRHCIECHRIVMVSIESTENGKYRKHPGGRGNAGGLHHHRILFDKYYPGCFGKVGMRYFHKILLETLNRHVINRGMGALCPQRLENQITVEKSNTKFGIC